MTESSSASGERSRQNPTELGSRIIEILRGPLYEKAREAIIHYETIERERSTGAIIELRDALDHMWHAAQANESEDAKQRLQNVTEHLRRAAVEPAQDMVENRLHQIYHDLKRYEFRRFFYGGLPPREQVNEEVREVTRLLELGRNAKSKVEDVQTALDYFNRAHVAATNLKTRIDGTRIRLYVRLAIYLLPVAIGIGGLIVGVLAWRAG